MFELNVFDFEKDEIKKTVKRNFCPTYLYIEFERTRAEVEKNNLKNDLEILDTLCEPFLKLFPDLTKEEYYNGTVIGDIMYLFGFIVNKAVSVRSNSPSKNA